MKIMCFWEMYQEPISGRAPGMMLLYHLSYAYSNMRPNTSVADAYNTHIRVRNCGLIWPLTENRDWCKWGMLWHWQTANRPALIFWWILMSVRMYNVNVLYIHESIENFRINCTQSFAYSNIYCALRVAGGVQKTLPSCYGGKYIYI